jgi:hypothetical protein
VVNLFKIEKDPHVLWGFWKVVCSCDIWYWYCELCWMILLASIGSYLCLRWRSYLCPGAWLVIITFLCTCTYITFSIYHLFFPLCKVGDIFIYWECLSLYCRCE